MDFLIQAVGFAAIAFNLIAVQFNSHGKIVFLKTIGSFLFGVQYFLLSAYTGVVMELVGWIRNFIFIYLVKHNKPTKWWILFFSLFTVATGLTTIILTWESSLISVAWLTKDTTIALLLTVIISALSIIAKVLSTIAYGINDAHKIRMINLPTCSCWIIYNFVSFSLAGVLNEAMSIASIIIAEIRYKHLKPNKSTTILDEQVKPENENPTV